MNEKDFQLLVKILIDDAKGVNFAAKVKNRAKSIQFIRQVRSWSNFLKAEGFEVCIEKGCDKNGFEIIYSVAIDGKIFYKKKRSN